MSELKVIPIGHEDFKEIIDKNLYYVDKTLMVKDIIDCGSKVSLFTRPRRFGKTLNMSMIKYYFEKSEQDNSYLFGDLNISRVGDKYKAYMGKYPVISLSLKSMKQPTFEDSFAEYRTLIIREFERHQNALKSNFISIDQKKQINTICERTAERIDYAAAIKLLSDCLHKVYNEKVIILIDEYDVPLENAYFNGFYDKMISLVRSTFESALKTNSSLEFGILTGCLRVSRESIFTGLNNLYIYTVLSYDFSQYFGFTENEISRLAEYYNIADKLPEMKKWYDGYLFGNTEIYNPWSILNYIKTVKSGRPDSAQAYWSNTSSNDIIHKLISESELETKSIIEKLLNDESIKKPIHENVTYQNLDINSNYIWSFLLFTGYLKLAGEYDSVTKCYEMTIPNYEVKTIYENTIIEWFQEKIRTTSRNDLFDAMINENIALFEEKLNDWLEDTISYYDNKENYYHGFLAGLFSGFKGYSVKSNRESGEGRPDILITERRKRKLAIIIEIKTANKFTLLSDKCDEALQQIESKDYATELALEGYQKIIKYGIAFYNKSCKLKLKP